MKTYLDENGLLYLWAKIKSHVVGALTPYEKTADVNTKISTTEGKITAGVDEAKGYTDTKLGDYYTKTEVDAAVDDVEVDLSGYYTKSETDTKIADAVTSGTVDLSNYYTKTEVDSKVVGVYTYKGSVNSYNDLPTIGLQAGWVYNVATADKTHGVKAGDNLAWTGTAWDNLGGDIDLSDYLLAADVTAITNSTIDTITAS